MWSTAVNRVMKEIGHAIGLCYLFTPPFGFCVLLRCKAQSSCNATSSIDSSSANTSSRWLDDIRDLPFLRFDLEECFATLTMPLFTDRYRSNAFFSRLSPKAVSRGPKSLTNRRTRKRTPSGRPAKSDRPVRRDFGTMARSPYANSRRCSNVSRKSP